VQIFTDASMKHDKAGYSIVIWMDDAVKTQVQRTVGMAERVNVFIAETGQSWRQRTGRRSSTRS